MSLKAATYIKSLMLYMAQGFFWFASAGGSVNSSESLARLAATINVGACCLPVITVRSTWMWSDPSAWGPCAADTQQPCSRAPLSRSPLGVTA